MFAIVDLVRGNPVGGKVGQGSATFTTSGSQLTINTSDRAFISWQSFNIGVGETTTFVQPSSSSVVWNQINDPNASQILGNLNANGYVILQNAAGFYVGGQASITTHGLMLTTAPINTPDLSGSGPWEFSAPPPTASIINYGHINIIGGGSAFLIAHDIDNQGTITAPGGSIGLYAGQDVLISSRPDGRGLSATVTLPEGSVNNSGKLIADGGSIALHAQVVNQGGLIQANAVQKVNGTIELVASDAVNLGAGSVLSAHGDSQGVSSGGSVLVKSGNTFSDLAGSSIDISGGTHGGNGGQLEISAANLGDILSGINGRAATHFRGGTFTMDPEEWLIDAAFISSHAALFNSSSGLYEINVQADDTITVSTLWNLVDPGGAALLTLSAGNDIIFNDGSGIKAAKNWSLSLSAGPANPLTRPEAGSGSILLNGSAFIETQNGDINLLAANDIIVNSGAVRTRNGGNIDATATKGDVNTGVNINGFLFGQTAAPFYAVNSAALGGISTAAGGNVTISAGGDVTSFAPIQTADPNDYANAKNDAGTGAFGGGDVTIDAGGNVYGHYVLANGTGKITAGGDIGQPILDSTGHNSTGKQSFALSLVKGSWDVSAGGNLYVQDVRNPSGVFNERANRNSTYAGFHLFNYDQFASVSFEAGNLVEFTGLLAPHLPPSSEGNTAVPFILPPTLKIIAGAGGVLFDQSLEMYPSAHGNLNLTTIDGGNFSGIGGFDARTTLTMLSGDSLLFDNGNGPVVTAGLGSGLLDDDGHDVVISISGKMESIDLTTVKATHITVVGDLKDVGFTGKNLHSTDTTSLNVNGNIINTPGLHFVDLASAIISANPLRPDDWNSVFQLAVNPALIGADTTQLGNVSVAQYIQAARLFQGIPNFVYDSATHRLGFNGDISLSDAMNAIDALKGTVTVIVMGANGAPVIDTATGKIETTTYTFLTKPANNPNYDPIGALETGSVGAPPDARPGSGYTVGGPGTFAVTAGSVDLGNSSGIVSFGGAAVSLTSVGDITMLTSRIASFGGGDVTVNSVAGSIDLGSQNLFIGNSGNAYGVYTSGHSDVTVTAHGDVDINGSRIAAYDGGNVTVESSFGNVNVGSGGNNYVTVPLAGRPAGQIYGSGIVAVSLPGSERLPGDPNKPGNITVSTPRGNIVASQAGILQLALDGNVAGGPTVTLTAGTAAVKDDKGNIITPAIPGNIDMGASGLIGGAVDVTAQGNITGLFISRQSSIINAAQNFSGTLLSAGSADVSAGGTVAGVIIGVGGANVSGTVTADVLGQNVSVNGGTAQSTLGTTATATAASQSAANQATSDAAKEVASDNSDDDDKKKKGKGGPALARRTGRVTVILPKAI
jgi:filamentous hemagglutinin family protein